MAAVGAIFFFAFAFHYWLEFQTGPMLAGDGYYHIKIASLRSCAVTAPLVPEPTVD